jgi:hypothetical protein
MFKKKKKPTPAPHPGDHADWHIFPRCPSTDKQTHILLADNTEYDKAYAEYKKSNGSGYGHWTGFYYPEIRHGPVDVYQPRATTIHEGAIGGETLTRVGPHEWVHVGFLNDVGKAEQILGMHGYVNVQWTTPKPRD